MTDVHLSLCGHSHQSHVDIADARGKDPTRTYFLRARMRADGDRRWQALARMVRQSLIEHDLVGLRSFGRLPHGDKTAGFSQWLGEELRQKIFGYDGSWLKPYVQKAAGIAQKHADEHAPGGQVDPGRVIAMQSLAVSELRGIVAAAQQQITRTVTHSLMASASPTQTANAVATVIRTMRNRTRAMSEYVIAKSHVAATLSAFRNAGVTLVGVIPERVRKQRIKLTPHGKVLVGDFVDPKRIWSQGELEGLSQKDLRILARKLGIHDPAAQTIENILSRQVALRLPGVVGVPITIPAGPLAGMAENKVLARFIALAKKHGLKAALPKIEKEVQAEQGRLAKAVAGFGEKLEKGTAEFVAKREAEGAALRAGRAKVEQHLRAALEAKAAEKAAKQRKKTPSPSVIGHLENIQKKLKAEFGEEGLVDVITAGDDDVCFECQSISDEGPYSLDEAEGLIPAHPWCRCGFVPAGKYEKDALWEFSIILRDFDPDQPRDPGGKWSSGGGASVEQQKSGKFQGFMKGPIGSFMHTQGRDVINAIGHKLHENQKELLAGAITFGLYHIAGADFPEDVAEQLREQVVHFADNASVSVAVARDYMQRAVNALIALRSHKDSEDAAADPVLKALLGLKSILDRDSLWKDAFDPDQPRDPDGKFASGKAIESTPSVGAGKIERLYRAGGPKARYGDTTFFSYSPKGSMAYGDPQAYDVEVPPNTFNAAGEHYSLYKQFLEETGNPAGRGRNALPFWTAEPDLRKWLEEKGHKFSAIRFDENTGVPSIGIIGQVNAKLADALRHAAGVMFRTPTGHMLLMKRADSGEWSIPAGIIDPGEEPLHAAQREAAEETGFAGGHEARKLDERNIRFVHFHTFLQPVENQFDPILNSEHTEFGWFQARNLPEPLHPGLRMTLRAVKGRHLARGRLVREPEVDPDAWETQPNATPWEASQEDIELAERVAALLGLAAPIVKSSTPPYTDPAAPADPRDAKGWKAAPDVTPWEASEEDIDLAERIAALLALASPITKSSTPPYTRRGAPGDPRRAPAEPRVVRRRRGQPNATPWEASREDIKLAERVAALLGLASPIIASSSPPHSEQDAPTADPRRSEAPDE